MRTEPLQREDLEVELFRAGWRIKEIADELGWSSEEVADSLADKGCLNDPHETIGRLMGAPV
jgi:hypothetical protein